MDTGFCGSLPAGRLSQCVSSGLRAMWIGNAFQLHRETVIARNENGRVRGFRVRPMTLSRLDWKASGYLVTVVTGYRGYRSSID